MNSPRSSRDLALVVPFYNEERFLPRLVESLRVQSVQDVPVIFVDNASTDRSLSLIQECQEFEAGKWICIEEETIGKVHAMRTATAFCTERLGVRNVGFLDADSYLGDPAWVQSTLDILDAASGLFGYTYSPFGYFGFEELPVFKAAYHAYEHVLQFLVKNVGWLANGQGFVCSVDVLEEYFQKAELTTEIDLRCSLLALSRGRRAYFNPGVLVSSGRRIIVNARNFASWCFYERDFYSKKDVNAPHKLNLNTPTPVEDLPRNRVRQFFSRRATKITCRHLVPLCVFEESSFYLERLKMALGVDLVTQLNRSARRFREDTVHILTDQFEVMIKAIERDPATIHLADEVARLMHQRYRPANP